MPRSFRLLTLCLALLGALLASPARAQWTPDTPVVLRGKIVSMHTGVKRGQLVIRGGLIEAILTPSAEPPEGAIVIETGGFIYPGLINLHNHLRYNMVSLYPLPRHAENHDDWPSGKDYAQYVNNPALIATSSKLYDRLDEALKYAEVRSLVGGETSVQGAENNGAIKSTLVRNVELPNFGEDSIGQRAFSMDRLFWDHLPETIDRIKATSAWLYHMAEGIDERARQEWSYPEFDPSKPFSTSRSRFNRPGAVEADLVWPGLVGVHCTAMTEDDFRQWRQITGEAPRLVWSPTSNLLLYGQTTDINAAQRVGAVIALGTDWAPSGTKNLLWELKVVHRLNQQSSPRLFRGYKQLVELVTTNPARILGWQDKVGQLRVGYHADVLVVDDLHETSSGYKNLILATEPNVQLVFVGGNPLYGDEAHMARLKTYEGAPRYEVLPDSPAGRPKAIDMLEDPTVRNGDLSLAEVEDRLKTALSLDAEALADYVNAGVQETQTRTTYKARDYIKAELVKLLEREEEDVDPELRDEDAPITAAQVERFFELKYPHMEPISELEPLFTDERFFDALEANLHWQDGTVDLDLRDFYRPTTPSGDGPGLVGAVTEATEAE